MKSIIVILAIVLPLVSNASIEVVISPDSKFAQVEILRWALYRDGDVVKYGRCDILEAECSPDSPSLEIQRELPYAEYIKRIANRYNVPLAYLQNHKAGLANYLNYRQILQRVTEDPNLPNSEKKEANEKFSRLTQKGGTLERFFKALALKREIQWPRTEEQKAEFLDQFGSDGFDSSILPPVEFGSPALSPAEASTYRQMVRRLLASSGLSEAERASLQSRFDRATATEESLARVVAYIRSQPSLSIPSTADAADALMTTVESVASGAGGAAEATESDFSAPNPNQIFTYEKSMHQYEAALYPMNFAKILKPDAKKVEEPSTGLTWALGGASLTYAEAIVACKGLGEGWRAATQAQIEYAAPWLGLSTIGQLIPVLNGEKFVWMDGEIRDQRKHMGKKYQTIQTSKYSSKSGDFDYFHSTYRFQAMAIWPNPRSTYVDHATSEEKTLGREDIVNRYGTTTTRLGSLCVTDTSY